MWIMNTRDMKIKRFILYISGLGEKKKDIFMSFNEFYTMAGDNIHLQGKPVN